MDYNNFFRNMMEDLNHEMDKYTAQQAELKAKRERVEQASRDGAVALRSAYEQLIAAGFSADEALDLLKALIGSASAGGGK